MAVAFVALNGHTSGLSLTAGATYTFTTTRNILVGELCVAATGFRPGAAGAGPVTAVQVGTLNLTQDVTTGANQGEAALWSAYVNTQINSGATVTVTVTSATNGFARGCSLFSLSGTATSSYVRTSTHAIATGTNPNPGATDGTPLTGDMIIGVCSSRSSSGLSVGSGLTQINILTEATNGTQLLSEYLALSSGGSADANFTQTASQSYDAVSAVYKNGSQIFTQSVSPTQAQSLKTRKVITKIL